MLCDTHCHLDFDWFDTDRRDVLERARHSGVNRILNPGVDLPSSRKAVRLAEETDFIYAAVGVHPNDGNSWNEDTLVYLNRLAESQKVRAIGEIGLDYHRKQTMPELQQRIFEEQLNLAAALDLPVVVHIRDDEGIGSSAIKDAYSLLQKYTAQLKLENKSCSENPGVLHSFGGCLEAAEQAIEMGFCIGIGGPVTYKNADTLKEIAAKLPLNSILLETDAPFLSPAPQRGKRNEPGNVRLVAEEIARLRNLDSNDIFNITTRNAERLFRW